MWGCWPFSSWSFMHGGFGPGGWFVGLLVLLAVLWLIRRVFGLGGGCCHQRNARADRDDALRLLDRRLAAGSITPEEYERLRRAIVS